MPRIERYLIEQLNAIQRTENELSQVRAQIVELVQQEERIVSARLLEYERSRLAGKISLFVESASTAIVRRWNDEEKLIPNDWPK